jgi:hypothetical protein
MRRRRPLLRAAAVGGGAYMAGKRHAENQGYDQPQAQAPPPAPSTAAASGLTNEDTTRLGELGKLHDQGVLTDAEFAAQKSKILGGSG